MGSTVDAVMRSDISQPAPALITRAQSGERAAREQLARQAGESAYVFALQLTRSPDDARDVAQESLLRFFRHLDRFDPDQRIEPWLFGIVRNQVRDAARRARVRRHESLEAYLETGGAEPASDDDPAATVERRELRARVWHAISELSEQHREILVLRDYHGLRYSEIAGVLAIPKGTVMSRLHTARGRLREALRTDDPSAQRSTLRTTSGGRSDG